MYVNIVIRDWTDGEPSDIEQVVGGYDTEAEALEGAAVLAAIFNGFAPDGESTFRVLSNAKVESLLGYASKFDTTR